ncbi:MAG: NUDIX hydrolase [Sedimentisphaerales bacterium]|nr:NUDIX hydrolase [Sedimentisphaerales bacterium]
MAKKGKYIYDWPRPMVTVDAVVFTFIQNRAKILLINRKNEPFKGKWALPGGFVGIDEELADAAARELAEETALSDVSLEQMHTFGKCDRDPRGRQITIAFIGIAKASPKQIKAGDDAAKTGWFDIEKLPKDIAFDHKEIIRFGIRKLKSRKIYRDRSSFKSSLTF